MHVFSPHKDRPEYIFKAQVLKMIDILVDQGTNIEGTGRATLTLHELASELKTAWDTAVRKKATDAAKEKRDQEVMQEIEEVAGLVPPVPVAAPPVPVLAPRAQLVAQAPVMPDQRPIPANAPNTPYTRPLIDASTRARSHHHVAAPSNPSPFAPSTFAHPRVPFITPRPVPSPQRNSNITLDNPAVRNATARVVPPTPNNPQLLPIHLRNRDMIDEIDRGHTIATSSMDRLDTLLNGR